jgi:predicted ferric reductase
MDSLSWYSFVSGCLIALWLLLYSIYRVVHTLASGCLRISFFLKHFVYPLLFPRTRFVGTATRFGAGVVLVYLLANIFLVLIGTRANIGNRAATMSVINVIPLLCGPRLSLVAELLGISRRNSLWSHQWLGRTAIAQVLLHTITSLTGSGAFAWTAPNVFGAVVRTCTPSQTELLTDILCKASSAFGFIFLISVGFIRHAIYEWFLNSHTLLSAVVVVAAWRHVPSKTPAWLFLRIGMCLWAGATGIHWLVFAFRNLALGRPLATVVATKLSNTDASDHALVGPSNVLRVDITVPRPWRQVKAGQSIFLYIPSLGLFTGARGHPFMISWWERDEKGLRLSLLVQSRAGFTAALSRRTHTALRAFIDGPYGAPHNFGEYGTVIMFASGIGIAGHMPYIKDLILAYNNCEARTRRVFLVWQVEDERE